MISACRLPNKYMISVRQRPQKEWKTMAAIARRKLLLSALSGPFVLAQAGGPVEPRELAEFDGAPIQRIRDLQNMSVLEEEHLIKVDLPARIIVGEPFKATLSLPNHPRTGLHHVTWLRVFVERQMITFMTFAPVWQHPEVTLTLELTRGDRIEAVAACSRHAIWGMAAPITVAGDTPQPPAEAPVE